MMTLHDAMIDAMSVISLSSAASRAAARQNELFPAAGRHAAIDCFQTD